MVKVRKVLALAGALITAMVAAPAAMADGTETLGTPSIPIAEGTGAIVAGVGTQEYRNAPVSFDVEVPAGATVKQVLAYWEGHATPPDRMPDPSISLNGNAVDGTLIGGPTNFFGDEHFSTYRADVTDLSLVSPGVSTITVSDMWFESRRTSPTGNGGVGLIVIYDDGTPSVLAGLKDGSDLAYALFAAPLDTTVPQTFGFTASTTERTATLGMLAASVSGPDLDGLRGNVITGEFDTGQTFSFVNQLQSNDGFELDAVNLPTAIPAGATSVTVQVLSRGGTRPASLDWIGTTLSIDNPPPPPGGQGCTPGYWKNHLAAWGPTGYSPSQALSTVFSPTGLGALGSDSMLKALKYGGGPTIQAKKQILLRAAVASVLNAAHADVAFGSGPAAIISSVNAALESNDAGTILGLAEDLDDRNNAGCKLN